MKSVLGKMFLILVFGLFAVNAFAARNGGEFVWIMPYGSSVATLDPHNTNSEPNLLVIMNIHRGLYSWDVKKDTYQLELAESVKVSDDGLTFTYTLRDAKFHNGRKITADDVIYSYNRLVNPKDSLAAAQAIAKIKGVPEVIKGKAETISGLKKIDNKTVEITFSVPVDPGLILWRYNTSIVPKEAVEAENFASNPVGCGPFMFEKWVKGSEIILKKNPNFYKKGQPYLDKVVYKIMPDGAARDMAFMAKELDANLLGSDQYAKYRNDPAWKKYMLEVAEGFTKGMRFNPNFTLADGRKPFGDKRVRQAFNYAINRAAIIEKLGKGKGYPARGFLASTTIGYDPECKSYDYDLEKAKSLMKEAGYADGFETSVLAQSGSGGVDIMVAAASFLKKINVEMSFNVNENAVHYKNYTEGNYGGGAFNNHSAGPDPIDVMQRFLSDDARFVNRGETGLKIDTFDRTLNLAAQTRNQEIRLELIKIANDILTEEAVFWLYQYNKAVILHHPWVHGMNKVGVEMMFQDMEGVWVDETSPRANVK